MTGAVGRIITFYSYKGGTGRSMALANVAWILASNGHKVLAIDWDLEAPGLHRYFRPFLIDPELSDSPGLINFIWSYAADAMTPADTNQDERLRWERATDLNPYTLRLDWEFPREGCIDMICAGRQDSKYAELVNSFDWANLYRRLDGELLFIEMRRRFKDDYHFILIDSRTGVSDTSGICTVAMPDSVVAFYTLNRGSFAGVAAVLDSIRTQRGDDFAVFPIVTRVELAEKERLEAARKRMRGLFQKFFEPVVAGFSSQDYWADAEILYQPYYAYEEMLAVFGDPTGSNRSPTSLLAAMEKLTSKVTGISGIEMPLVPEVQRQEILGHFAGKERKNIPQVETSEDPEERRNRAERYLEKDLNALRFDRIAYFANVYTTICVFGSIASAVFLQIYVYPRETQVLFIACAAAVSKLFELMLPRWYKRTTGLTSFTGFVTLLLLIILAALFGLLSNATPETEVRRLMAVTTSIIGCAAQGWAMVGRFDERITRFRRGSEFLQREVREYVYGIGPYSEQTNPSEAWKRFVRTAGDIVDGMRRG